MTLISLLTTPVLELLQSVPAIVQCLGCFDRIQEYCSKPNSADDLANHSDVSPHSNLSNNSALQLTDVGISATTISIHDQSFGWNHGDPPILRDVNLVINPGRIVIAVGPVGSGKTTLLESVLGETVSIRDGSTNARKPSSVRSEIAYCSQSPWLETSQSNKTLLDAPKWILNGTPLFYGLVS